MVEDRERGSAKLALLSTHGKQVKVRSGHNMELEAPGEVTAAIREMVNAVRHHRSEATKPRSNPSVNIDEISCNE